MNKLKGVSDLLFLIAIRSRYVFKRLCLLNPKLESYKQQHTNMYPEKATIHLVSLGNEDDLRPSMGELEDKYPGITDTVRRGDIINNADDDQYRSSGSWMVETYIAKGQVGKCLVERGSEGDEYGNPAESFKVITEFPIGYWDSNYGRGNELQLHVVVWEPDAVNDFYWHSDEPPCTIDPRALNLAKYPIREEDIGKGRIRRWIYFGWEGEWYTLEITNGNNYKKAVNSDCLIVECYGNTLTSY